MESQASKLAQRRLCSPLNSVATVLFPDWGNPTEDTLRAGISRWSLSYNRWPSESPVWPNNLLVLKKFRKVSLYYSSN